MNKMQFPKEKLLTILQENRRSHRDLFLKAQEEFREEAIKQLEERLENTRKGKKIDISLRLFEPIDQTKDYDRVIKMLEMCVEEILELSESDFAQYVMDDWSWKDQVMTRNTMYSK